MFRRRRADPHRSDAIRSDLHAVDPLPHVLVRAVDEQADVTIDVGRYAALMSYVLRDEGVAGPGEATLLFVDVDTISQLNALHMGVSGPTDVLSFPIDAGDTITGVDERLVGDVVVCPSVAAEGAPTHTGNLEDEVALLVVHGTLHLLGHDHAGDDERARMWHRERELMVEHWGELERDPWV